MTLTATFMHATPVVFLMSALAQPLAAQAGDAAVTTKLGSLGLGVELTTEFSESLNGRFGINHLKYKYAFTEDQIKYDTQLNLQSASFLVDWYPSNGIFRTSLGVLYNNNKYDLKAKPSTGTTYTINNVIYNGSDIGSLYGDARFNKVAPYLGVGWGNHVNKANKWTFVADVGMIYQGKPKTNLAVACSTSLSVAQCDALKTNVAAEQVKVQESMKDYRWLPSFSVGAAYRF